MADLDYGLLATAVRRPYEAPTHDQYLSLILITYLFDTAHRKVSSGLPSWSYCMSKTSNANLHLLYNITASLDLLLDIRGWRSNRRIPRVIHLYLKDRSNPAKYRSTTGITFSNWGVVSAMIIGRYFSFTLLSTITKQKPLRIQFYAYSIFYRYNRSGWATETTRMIAIAATPDAGWGEDW